MANKIPGIGAMISAGRTFKAVKNAIDKYNETKPRTGPDVTKRAKGGMINKYAKGGEVKGYMGGGSVHKKKNKMLTTKDIKELKGYNKPSVYKGQKADRLISELGIGTVEDFNKLAREQGLGSFGKDKEATKFLNQLLTKAGKPNYSTVAPIQRAVEKELFPGSPQKTKMDRNKPKVKTLL